MDTCFLAPPQEATLEREKGQTNIGNKWGMNNDDNPNENLFAYKIPHFALSFFFSLTKISL